MIKAVVFDLDDTLFQERKYVISGFNACIPVLSKIKGLPDNVVLDMLTKLYNENPMNVFDRFVSEQALPYSLISECVDIYRNHTPSLTLKADVKEILYWLKSKNIALGIVTDGRPKAQWAKIRALELDSYMDSIIVTDELGGIEFRKPCPLGFWKILKALNTQPEYTAYVGDNTRKDFIAPNQIGMISIYCENADGLYANCVSPSGGEPKYRICYLSELKPLIDRLSEDDKKE